MTDTHPTENNAITPTEHDMTTPKENNTAMQVKHDTVMPTEHSAATPAHNTATSAHNGATAAHNGATPTENSDRLPKRYLVIALGILCAAGTWFFGLRPFIVSGISMYPTFNSTPLQERVLPVAGDYLVIDIFSYTFLQEPKRFDVVVFNSPVEQKRYLLKRIIGLPNELIHLSGTTITVTKTDGTTIMLEEPYINQEEIAIYQEQSIQLEDDQYFLLGDNRTNSYDSRIWHGLKRENIVGRVLLRLYPFDEADFKPGTVND